ncbi:MAG: hypothetical protein J0H98_10630 [Solirubrobacterales bacterium]|nr:hypothetical protein [Solirubrobacterales bacterium]
MGDQTTITKRDGIRFANALTEDEVIDKYLPSFKEAFERLRKPGHDMVYNHDLLGQVEGLAGTPDESRAIYWLQCARRIEAHFERVDNALENGWVDYGTLPEDMKETRPESVLLVGRGKDSNVVGGSTEWIEIPKGRIVLDPETAEPTGVLPKGKRVYGAEIGCRRLLVKFTK